MILTNVLLNIGLSLTAAFTNAVPIPVGTAPSDIKCFERVVFGSPESPVDLFFRTHSGGEFWIHDGVVCRFSCTDSILQLQDPERVRDFSGMLTLTSNEVVDIATTVVERIARKGNPTANLKPTVQTFEVGKRRLASYAITWPDTNMIGSFKHAAILEIDARKGQVVFMDLRAPGFYDFSFAQQISNTAYVPDMRPQTDAKRNGRIDLPRPNSDQTSHAVQSWMLLCAGLGVGTRSNTNVDSIDWGRTFVYTNEVGGATHSVCQIRFKDGTSFESIEDTAISHVERDACFCDDFMTRPEKEWDPFKGSIAKEWENLASQLELALTRNIGIPKKALSPFSPGRRFHSFKVGDQWIKRIVVDWRAWPSTPGTFSVSDARLALFAEFDLETGELKSIRFEDPTLIEILQKTITGTRPGR